MAVNGLVTRDTSSNNPAECDLVFQLVHDEENHHAEMSFLE